MKISDKALRLIGLTVMGSMDNKKIQDDSKHPPNSAKPGGYGRPRLTPEARLKTARAPVIPFQKKKSES
jgi:hypothetical protein